MIALVLSRLDGSSSARAGYGAAAMMVGTLAAVGVEALLANGDTARVFPVSAALSVALASRIATRTEFPSSDVSGP